MIRYFFASTVGDEGINRYNNCFSFQTYNGCFPSYRDIIEISHEKYPLQNNIILNSISEMSESDFIQFKKQE